MRRIIYHLAVIVALISLATGATPRPPAAAECPTVTIDCSVGIVCPDEPTTFTATINGGDPSIQPTFKWTLSAGTITGGQGTPTITVDVTGLGSQSVTATVELSGLTALTADCAKSASCKRQIGNCTYHRKYDEYGEISLREEKERLDNFAIQLKNETRVLGIIIVYGGLRAKRGDADARADRAKNYLINKHGIEAERIMTITGGNVEGSSVELWVGTPGKGHPTAIRTDAVEPLEP